MIKDQGGMDDTMAAIECEMHILMQCVRLDEVVEKLITITQKKKAEAQHGEANRDDWLMNIFQRLSARVETLMNDLPSDSLDLLEQKLLTLVQKLLLQQKLQDQSAADSLAAQWLAADSFQ
jgi:hypothetical protein